MCDEQGEDPDVINRLDEMIAEGAFGAVYKVSANSRLHAHTKQKKP